MWTILVTTVSLIWLAQRYHHVRKSLQNADRLPRLWCLFPPMSIPGALLPAMPLNPGLNWTWTHRNSMYSRLGSETIVVIPLISGDSMIYTSSPEVARQTLSGADVYIKSPESMQALLLWGDNTISANHENYKRHRRIVGPAFTTSTYSLVWRESLKLYREMQETEGWVGKPSVQVSSINEFMSKFALVIISRCGFGISFPWKATEAEIGKQKKKMSFPEALEVASKGVIARLATPSFMYRLNIESLNKIDQAYRDLGEFMHLLISQKRDGLSSGTDSRAYGEGLFNYLVRANEDEDKLSLTDSELIGNMFSFLFAGHETTGHTLSATLALLALYTNEQEIAFQEIMSVSGQADPDFEDYGRYGKVLACFQEAARMFPAGSIVTRDPVTDVTLAIPDVNADTRVAVAAGVRVISDMIGIHYNPRIFDSPEEFRPSRWYGKLESELSFFGYGPRACLGRKFAMSEALALLIMVLKDWRIEPVFEPGETDRKWRERVLQGGLVGLGFGIRPAPLRFTSRRST